MYKQPMREILAQPPQEKEYLNSGIVIIRENIVEDTTNTNFTVYTWLETRYSQLEYLQVIEQEGVLLKRRSKLIEKEKQQQWDTLEYILKATGCIGVPIDGNIVDNI